MMTQASTRVRRLAPAHPYFGSKAEAADRIWEHLGNPNNFVDAFTGSASVLFARPDPPTIETINDAWAFVPNFLRAIRDDPEAVARWADHPVSEVDLQARHRWLLATASAAFVERCREDEGYFDPKIAGYWVWGSALWIGSGWCIPGSEGKGSKLPHLTGAGPSEANRSPHYGRGIFRKQLAGVGVELVGATRRARLVAYFRLLAERLELVRITCGDWRRVLTPAVTFSHGTTGIFLDPPYGREAKCTRGLFADESVDLSAEARGWALTNGDNPDMRIILAGYEGEHEMLASYGWRPVSWKGRGGYSNQDSENENAGRERLWISPYCLGGSRDLPLFAGV